MNRKSIRFRQRQISWPLRIEFLEDRAMLASFAFEPTSVIAQSDISDLDNVVAGDLDGDDDDDIVFFGNREFGWFQNDSNTFVARELWDAPDGPWRINEVFVHDLDLDGDNDIVFNMQTTQIVDHFPTLRSGDRATFWIQNLDGQGTFGPARVISDEPTLIIADIDSDGDSDFWTMGTGPLSWVENQGGTFAKRELPIFIGYGAYFRANASDLDQDGDSDLVVASWNKITWYDNDGAGSFSVRLEIETDAFTNFEDFLPPPPAAELELVDLDGDGDDDIITSLTKYGQVAWFENLGGSFGDRIDFAEQAHSYEPTVRIGDIDGDSDYDLVFGSMEWIEQTGNKTFSEIKSLGVSSRPAIALGELDGSDGIEILLVDQTANQLSSLDYNADEQLFTRKNVNPRGISVATMQSADLDTDGDADLLVTTKDGLIRWYEDVSSAAEQRRFETARDIVQTVEVGEIRTADMDSDGDLDIVAVARLQAEPSSPSLVWFANENGIFEESHVVSSESLNLASLDAGDVDGDGDIDLVATGITWYENLDGTGTMWRSELISDREYDGAQVQITDLDSDGDGDIVATFRNYYTTVWYEKTNEGFNKRHIINERSSRFTTADIDNDGDTDVITSAANRIRVHYNLDGNGQFGDGTVLTHGTISHHLFTMDADNDGDLDLFADQFSFENLEDFYAPGRQADHGNAAVPLDVDRDGFVDIISAFDDRIVVQTNVARKLTGLTNVHHITQPPGVQSVAAADFDLDGDLDIVTASSSGPSLSWRENFGNGTLSSARTIESFGSFYFVTTADIDGDQAADIVVSSHEGGSVYWYQNLKNGRFGERQLVTRAIRNLSTLSAVDMDGDTDLDLVIKTNAGIAWLENENGRFSQPIEIPSRIPIGSDRLTVRDFDGDGDFDIAFGSSQRLVLLRNDDLTFTSTVTNLNDGSVTVTDAFDIDNDGDEDIIYIGGRRLSYLRNEGGSFTPGGRITSVPNGTWVTTSGDMNGDGSIDTLYSWNSQQGGGVVWVENLGDGQFGAKKTIAEKFSGVSPLVADISGNGQNELAIGRGFFEWFRSNDNGQTFLSSGTNSLPGGSIVADVNDDGRPDLVKHWVQGAGWYENERNGEFGPLRRITDLNSRLATVADVDSDGDQDFIATNYDENSFDWHRNVGSFFLRLGSVGSTSGTNGNAIPADIDNDGDQDFFLLSSSPPVQWIENLSNGEFDATKELFDTSISPREIIARDFDQDGDIDVVAAGSRLELRVNQGDNQFASAVTIEGLRIDNVTAVDMDGDGDLDLVGRQPNVISWWENDGGTFGERQVIASESFLAVNAADLDGDGDAEILAGMESELIVFFNHHGQFERRTKQIPAMFRDRFESILIDDVDGDGDPDPVVTAGSKTVWVENEVQMIGDMDLNESLDVSDIDRLCRAVRSHEINDRFDINRDRRVDEADVTALVESVFKSTVGDVNLDGVFDSTDLLTLFQKGQYEDGVAGNSDWSSGDWNCDGEVSAADLVFAFKSGNYVSVSQPF